MGEAAERSAVSLAAIRESLDLVHAQMGSMDARMGLLDTTYQQVAAQLDLHSRAVSDHTRVMDAIERRQEVMAQHMVAGALNADALVTPTMPTRYSTPGSPDNISNNLAVLAFPTSMHLPAPTLTANGDSALHGAGCTGTTMTRGCLTHIRTSTLEGFVEGARAVDVDRSRNNLFPRFDGINPSLWREKCLEFFTEFNICKPMWTTAARLHMDGKAKEWFEAYRLRQVVGDWSEFIDAVEANFGVCDFDEELQVPLLPSEAPVVGVAHRIQVWDSEPPSDYEPHDTYGHQLMTIEAHMGNMAPLVESLAKEESQEILTNIGRSSLFLERVMEVTDKAFDAMLLGKVGRSDMVLTHVNDLSLFAEQIMGAHQELDGVIDEGTILDLGVGGVRVVSLAVPSAEGKLQQLLSRETQPGTNMATLVLPWDPGVWINFTEMPELSTTRTSEKTRLSQNMRMLPGDIFCMKLNEQIWLEVQHLATQIWDPGILSFLCTNWFCCYVILMCRCLLLVLLRRTSQHPTQTSETCHAFLAYYRLIKACLLQLLAVQWGKNQPELVYVPLPPFWCDILLWYCWEHMLDGKESWNHNGFNIIGIESACCIIGKVPPWRQSAFSPGKVEITRGCKLSSKMLSWTRAGFSPGKDEQQCFNCALPWTSARNCNKVALPILPFRNDLADCTTNTSRSLGIQLKSIQLSGLDTCQPESGITQWKVPWKEQDLGIQFGDQLEVLRCCSAQLVLCLCETWAWLDGSPHVPRQHTWLNSFSVHMSHFAIPRVLSWAEERWTLLWKHENNQSRVFFSKKSSSHLRGLSMPWDPGGIHETRILQAIAWGQAMFCEGGSVTPVPSGILGLQDMGHGPAALGLSIAYSATRREQQERRRDQTENELNLRLLPLSSPALLRVLRIPFFFRCSCSPQAACISLTSRRSPAATGIVTSGIRGTSDRWVCRFSAVKSRQMVGELSVGF